MDSTTLLGIVGIGGTLLGTFAGAYGAVTAARVSSRGQANVEDQRSRRQAYSACSTALITRRDAATALMDSLREEGFGPETAQILLKDLLDQRSAVMRMVGATVVEGPYPVARLAESAATALQEWVDRLRDWITTGDQDVINDQFRFGREDQQEVTRYIDEFARECRKVLHPQDEGEPKTMLWLR